jgi:hypothetical protein
VITNGLGFAVAILVGVSASIHDFRLGFGYLTRVEDLIPPHERNHAVSSHIKDMSEHEPQQLSNPRHHIKIPRGRFLSTEKRHANRLISSERVIIENYFGSLSYDFNYWQDGGDSKMTSVHLSFEYAVLLSNFI